MGVFVSLRDPSLCRVIQVQIDLLFGLNLHTTSEMKYFFKKIFYLVTHTHPRASLVCSVPPLKKELNFFSPTSRPPKRSLRKQGNRRVRKKEVPPPSLGVPPRGPSLDPSTDCAPLLDLRRTHRLLYMTLVALPYPTRSLPPPGEEPYAGGRADLPWKPYLRRLLGRQ